jgi:PAS domain S-box-containing protein
MRDRETANQPAGTAQLGRISPRAAAHAATDVAPARQAAAATGVDLSGSARLPGDRDAARRVMVGALVVLAIQFIYIWSDLRMPAPLLELFLPRHIANVAGMALLAAAMSLPGGERWWREGASFGCILVVFNGTWANVVTHDPLTQLLSLVVITVGVAALVPWNAWWQAALNAMCLTSFAVVTAGSDAVDPHFWAVMLGAVAVAQATAVFSERTRRELAERTSVNRAIIDSATEAIFSSSLDGRIMSWNPAAEWMFGYRAEDVLGQSVEILIPEGGGDDMRAAARAIEEGAGAQQYDSVRRRKDGSTIYVSVTLSPIREASGALTGIAAIARDISSRIRIERELRETAARFRGIFNQSLDPISIQRLSDLTYVDVNDEFLRINGLTREQVIGKTPWQLNLLGEPDATMKVGPPLARDGFVRNFEMVFRTHDGYTGPGLLSASIVEVGGEQCVLATVRDIRERKLAELELIAAREAALEAARAKSAFLAGMSHELRTPLGAMIGMAELLWETDLNAEQREYVRIFRSNGAALLRIIGDILDLTKVESGRFTLENVPFDLAEAVDHAMETLSARAQQKGLALRSQIDPAVPRAMVGDPLRLRQVLLNVIGNAIKFTETGSIALHIACEAADGDSGAIHFAISDTGIGIPADKLRSIFEEFSQVDSSTTRKYGGTGLGLAISRRLVEMMNGRIWAESAPGSGTTFHFIVRMALQDAPQDRKAPAQPADATAAEPAAIHRARALRILLAEDSEENRGLVAAYLRKTPHVLDVAENGARALEMFRVRKYDAVLMDLQMPVMDGYSAARAIRQLERDSHRARTPILALTANAFSEDAEQSRAAGCDEHLTKPIRRATLLAFLDAIARRVGEDSALSAAAGR